MEKTLYLPKNYEIIEDEEMMYLDGGIAVYDNWWGISIKLTKTECRYLAYGATALSIAGAYSGNPIIVAAIAFGALFAQIGADGRGMWINKPWVGNTWISY